jgi:hypothetical protein
MTDLSNLDVIGEANKGALLELLHPATGEVLFDEKGDDESKYKAFYLKLLGSDSDVYRSEIKRRTEKTYNSKSKSQKIDLDDAQLKGAQLLAKCTTSCYIIENGKEVKCTRDEMTRIYLTQPWIREQAEAFMSDRGNFIKS